MVTGSLEEGATGSCEGVPMTGGALFLRALFSAPGVPIFAGTARRWAFASPCPGVRVRRIGDPRSHFARKLTV
jgi:hypothetical protein